MKAWLPVLLAVLLAIPSTPRAILADENPEPHGAAGILDSAEPAGTLVPPAGDNMAISGGTAEPVELPPPDAVPHASDQPVEAPVPETTAMPPPTSDPAGDNTMENGSAGERGELPLPDAVPHVSDMPAEAPFPESTVMPPPTPLPDADRGGATDNTWLDRIHTYLERSLYKSSDWFDRSFGGEQVQVSERARSSLWWKNDFAWFQESGFEYRTTFRAQIWLPRLKNRLHLVIAGENQGDPTAAIPVDPGNPGTNVQSTQRAASGELVYDLYRTKQSVLSVGAGVKLAISTDAFARARLGYVQPLGTDLLGRFMATAYYNADAANGESNQLSFEWRLSPAVMLVWANSATIEEGSNGWNWGTDLAMGYKISESSAFTLGGSVTWNTRPDWEVQNYRVYTGYRRSIFRPWLFCELIPEVDWPLQSDGSRDTVWGVRLRLEVLFVGKELFYSEN